MIDCLQLPLQVETNFTHPSTTSQTSLISTCGCLTTKTLVVRQVSGTHSGCIGRWISLLKWNHAQVAHLLTAVEKPVTLVCVVLMGTASAYKGIQDQTVKHVSTVESLS